MNEGANYLDALAGLLDEIETHLVAGRDRYDADGSVRLAIQRLWIAAGECARRYCSATDTPPGEEPWSSLWGYRNFLAHQLPIDIDNNRVWLESTQAVPEYRAVIETLRQP